MREEREECYCKSCNGNYIATLNQYQLETNRTAGDDSAAVLTLGLCGESGEVAELIKKYLGHGHSLDKDKLKKELGDVLWYLARLSDVNGLSLQEVAQANVEKLRKRYPEGFSSQSSFNRPKEA